MSRRLVVVAALMSLLVWSGVVVADREGVTFASEHMRFTVFYADAEARIVISDGRELVLPQVPSASGARFAAGAAEFWNQGDAATFVLDGIAHDVRIVDPSTDVWLLAKEAGASFRGVGQEPGWMVEIYDGDRIYLLLDYGDTEISVPIASMAIDYAVKSRTYRTHPPLAPIQVRVTVQLQPCYDGMSGEGFTHRVEVEFPATGTMYAGCGRDLTGG